MKITPFIIERFASWLAGGTPFHAMKSLVQAFDDPEKSGADKRRTVLEAFQSLGYALAGWLTNLLLELAVAWLRSKRQ